MSRVFKYLITRVFFMVQTEDIRKQVAILDRYFISRQTIHTFAGFSPALYRQNLDAMLHDLQEAGLSDASFVAVTADDGPLTHVDGAFLNYHLVIYSGGQIFDPLYGGKEPLSRDTYVNRVFPGENSVRLWQQTAPGKYQQELH